MATITKRTERAHRGRIAAHVVALASALVPGLALAHPDHVSEAGHGLGHLLTDPFHLATAAAAVAAFFVLRRTLLRRRARATERVC